MFAYLPSLAGMLHVSPTEARRMRHGDLVRLTLSVDDELDRQRREANRRDAPKQRMVGA